MKLSFTKVNPVENMTIFVLDRIPREKYSAISNKLMDYSNLHGEQVGFIEEPITTKGKSLTTLRLQMMGGEFCGNAIRALAAYMVYDRHPSANNILEGKYNITLEGSGSKELLNCIVRKTDKEAILYSKIAMPLPERITIVNINKVPATRVDFEGISHFIVDVDEIQYKEDFYNHLKRYMDKEEYDAFGIMYHHRKEDFMEPLVYVKLTNTKLWERSCASGTSAFGIVKSLELNDNINLEVKQPGGILEIEVKLENGEVKEVFLDGAVEIVAEGIVNI